MSPRTRFAFGAALALAVSLTVPALAAAATTTAKLRVLTPGQVLDPGTTYYIDDSITVPTTPEADCLGAPGGSGSEYTYDDPNALSLLATAARASRTVRPLSLSDQFGFGLLICGIGGVDAGPSEFWYLKSNHEESTFGADQLTVERGDEILFYLAPDNFPEPNPAELELVAPAAANPGDSVAVSVVQHACTTDQATFEVSCSSTPAAGVTIAGGSANATTGADGTAQVKIDESTDELVATRGTDIPSEALEICVSGECPAKRGERIVGSPQRDKIKGTKGSDTIRARGGADVVDVRKGFDRVNCGPGKDRVLAPKSGDAKIARNCENVKE